MSDAAIGANILPGYAVVYRNGEQHLNGPWPPSFVLSVADAGELQRLQNADIFDAAMSFIRGDFSITGDLIAAIRVMTHQTKHSLTHWLRAAAVRLTPVRLETYIQSRHRAADNIRFHYDRSNEFYAKFLDSHLVYSSALFTNPAWSLETAQTAKLDSICRKLRLAPGETLLDVGCGWGALMLHAVEHYGVSAHGCTLSHNQCELARKAIALRGLSDRARVDEKDYREVSGRFPKISSIGMFEHVGRRRLTDYFRTIGGLLDDDGLFLNSGITRPQAVGDDPETRFLRNEVFPGGELAHLSQIVRSAEDAGFEVLELNSIRLDYGRTCREWVKRLQENARSCIELVGERTWRTWLLYLAASAVNFEDGQTDAYQILMAKRSARPL